MNAAAFFVLFHLCAGIGEPHDDPRTSPAKSVATSEHDGRGTHDRGQPEDALAEFQRAYTSLPDPVKQGAQRDIILGSMRGLLLERYEQTGAPTYLCRARDLQILHLEALLLAHGEDSDVDDISGTRRRLRQIREMLARHAQDDPCRQPLTTPPPELLPIPAKRPPAPPPPRWPRSTRTTLVGAISLGLASTLLGTTVYALLVRRFIYVRIQGLHEINDASPAAQELVDELRETGTRQRTVALATGITGATLLVGGAVALSLGLHPPRPRRYSLHPQITTNHLGLSLLGRF